MKELTTLYEEKFQYLFFLFFLSLFYFLSFYLSIIFAGQCRRSGQHRQMVSAVHQFQGLAGNLAAGNASPAGPSNVNNSCRSFARSTTSARIHNNENHHHGSSSLSAIQLAQLNNIPK